MYSTFLAAVTVIYIWLLPEASLDGMSGNVVKSNAYSSSRTKLYTCKISVHRFSHESVTDT